MMGLSVGLFFFFFLAKKLKLRIVLGLNMSYNLKCSSCNYVSKFSVFLHVTIDL